MPAKAATKQCSAGCEMAHVSAANRYPSLTFTLGGHEFSVPAFEYTLEANLPKTGRTCITTCTGASEIALPRDWEGIVLRSPFSDGFPHRVGF